MSSVRRLGNTKPKNYVMHPTFRALNSAYIKTCFHSQEEATVALPAADDDATKANPVASTCSQTLAREKANATTTLDLNSFAFTTT